MDSGDMDICWSTDEAGPGSPVEAWQAELSRQVLRIRVLAEAASFCGAFRLRRFGPTAFLRVRARPQTIMRGVAEIGGEDGAWLFVSTMIEGCGYLHHPGGVELVPSGAVSFVDGDQPFMLEFREDFAYVSVAALRRDMLALLPAAERSHGRVFPAPAGPALSSFMTVLEASVDADGGAGIGDENRLYDHFIGLAAAALMPGNARPALSPETSLLGNIKAYLVANLGADLPGSMVARHFGISERKLQRLFHDEGMTMSRWRRSQRLDRCARDLADPRQADRTLTAIATSRGFDDMSYFSRCFCRAFGASPSAYRRSHLAEDGGAGAVATTR
jgi:AraC-like DNA-binding protein